MIKLLATAALNGLLHDAYRLTLQGNSYRKPQDVEKRYCALVKKQMIIALPDGTKTIKKWLHYFYQ